MEKGQREGQYLGYSKIMPNVRNSAKDGFSGPSSIL